MRMLLFCLYWFHAVALLFKIQSKIKQVLNPKYALPVIRRVLKYALIIALLCGGVERSYMLASWQA